MRRLRTHTVRQMDKLHIRQRGRRPSSSDRAGLDALQRRRLPRVVQPQQLERQDSALLQVRTAPRIKQQRPIQPLPDGERCFIARVFQQCRQGLLVQGARAEMRRLRTHPVRGLVRLHARQGGSEPSSSDRAGLDALHRRRLSSIVQP